VSPLLLSSRFPDSATYHGVAASFVIFTSSFTQCTIIELFDLEHAVTTSNSSRFVLFLARQPPSGPGPTPSRGF